MWTASFIRFLKRRTVIAVIVILSFVYILKLLGQGNGDNDDDIPIRRTQPFIWRTLQQHNSSIDGDITCRNSVQGKVLIVDDRGYVCPRHEILPSGCCNDTPPSVIQYSCETCISNNCCAIYEYCISCCLNPDKRSILENILGKASGHSRVLFASVNDHFELCLTKCRTNSQSVRHENSYKDPKAKHCYGEHPPGTSSLENEV